MLIDAVEWIMGEELPKAEPEDPDHCPLACIAGGTIDEGADAVYAAEQEINDDRIALLDQFIYCFDTGWLPEKVDHSKFKYMRGNERFMRMRAMYQDNKRWKAEGRAWREEHNAS